MLLLGGTGSRLGTLTKVINKHLLPVYASTLAEHALQWLLASGFERVVPVVPRDDRYLFERLLAGTEAGDAVAEIVEQPRPIGTGDAVRRAVGRARSDEVVVLFGDNVFGGSLDDEAFRTLRAAADACCYSATVDEDLDQFSVIVAEDPVVLVPKPHTRSTGRAVSGLFLLRPAALMASAAASGDGEDEDDLMTFLSDCAARSTLEVRDLRVAWRDAGYSVESLWRAGAMVRSAAAAGRRKQSW